jgi:hypothetical protein
VAVTKPTSPLDTTGRAAETAAKKVAEDKAKQDAATAQARALEELSLENEVFDPKKPDAPVLIDEVEELGVSVTNSRIVIRTHQDIDDMTFGIVNGTPQNYTFKAGVKYTVPVEVAAHLERLGYIWR